ncbi:MAG TPA: carbon-nitrogen hydrolase family protein, partial [Stackebrandtia sp.]|uniref:carbon-nitrogen hydrolase family protein n=1 Tax=Stackebrandtia sp. TaxID=2023065 RepID=UPI002D692D94
SAAALAATADAALVVFGELHLPAYHPPTLARDPSTDIAAAADGTVDDERLDPLRATARGRGVAILIGAAVRRAGRRFIASLLIAPSGTVRDVYHKRHLCDAHERELFSPGDRATTLALDGWRLGLGICYDATFPEHARAAALAGCHAYVAAGAYVAGGEHRRDLYHRARALDNTFYVVFADEVGGEPPWTFGGGGAVYDPEGRPVARAGADRPGIAVAALDPKLLTETRAAHTMLADRCPGPGQRDTVEVRP